ncbi:MAG: cyclase family protein [Ardenticatenales bacterium]|nr:cyclase family protein [Ardenticatenales bacterium]
MTRPIDLTRRITTDLPVWPGDLPPVITPVATHDAGDGYALSHLSATLHLGTHIDAPRHFIPDGATVDALPLAVLIGPAFVVDVPDDVRAIDAPYLERLAAAGGLPADAVRILFRTRNSAGLVDGRDEGPFRRDFVAVTAGGARYLVALGVRLVGIDGPSIAPWDDTDTPHVVLLGAGVVAVEGLAMAEAPPGHGVLVCLPLRIEGAEGAPARAVWFADAADPGAIDIAHPGGDARSVGAAGAIDVDPPR